MAAKMKSDRMAARRPLATTGRGIDVLLAILVVAALGGGVLIGRSTKSVEPPLGRASGEVATMLEDRIAAMNSGDGEAVAAFYTEDGVLEERDQQPAVVTEGRQQIARHLQVYLDLDFVLESESEVIQLGRYAAEAVTWPGGGGAILVYELDENLKITHQWVIGGNPY